MSPPARPTRPICALAVLAAVLLVSATVATATIPHDSDPALGHHCIHDEILEAQFGKQTLEAIVNSKQFTTSAVLEVPSSGASRASSGGYAPIRIKVFYEDVFDPTKYCTEAGQVRPDFKNGSVTCTDKDVLTPEKQRLLVQTMIPEAVMMHSERLSVQPLQSLYVSQMTGRICGSFAVPSDVVNNDVTGADFVLFVAAGPISGSTVAWATTCRYIGGERRPVVGVVNVKPRYITGTSQSIRTIAHEIMHALGFSNTQFAAHNMVATVDNLRGKPTTPVVNTPNTLAKAKEQFNCSTMPGMELDDSGGSGTAGSHWSVRNARDDMMCGYIGPMMRYTAVSMAAMEDLGFYKANYSMAEGAPWGHDVGCPFIDKKCVENGVSTYPTMFCTDIKGSKGSHICSADLLGIGYCPIETHSYPRPSHYRYFSNPHIGGDISAEHCPIAVPFSSRLCSEGNARLMPLSLLGQSSRCFSSAPGSTMSDPVCAEVQCNSDQQTYRVKFADSGATYVDCPEGSTIDARSSSSSFRPGSTFVCPPYFNLCSKVFTVGIEPARGDGVALGASAGLLSLGSLIILLFVLYA